MLLLFVFPNLSKNFFKLLNGLIAQWLNEVADAVELNHICGLDRYTFIVIILRTFRYFFLIPSFLTECKGRGLILNHKIVFKNSFPHQLFLLACRFLKNFLLPRFSFWECKDRDDLQTAKLIFKYF